MDIEFEWDPEKNRLNREKHGISFEEAVVIWEEMHVEVENIAHSEDQERRSATMGWIDNKLYVAVWTRRKEKIRIISVRRARKHEEKVFYKKIQN